MNCNSDCSTQPMYYRLKRYIVFGIITLIALILPFINIEGKHFFLLSFDKKTVKPSLILLLICKSST